MEAILSFWVYFSIHKGEIIKGLQNDETDRIRLWTWPSVDLAVCEPGRSLIPGSSMKTQLYILKIKPTKRATNRERAVPGSSCRVKPNPIPSIKHSIAIDINNTQATFNDITSGYEPYIRHHISGIVWPNMTSVRGPKTGRQIVILSCLGQRWTNLVCYSWLRILWILTTLILHFDYLDHIVLWWVFNLINHVLWPIYIRWLIICNNFQPWLEW